MVEINTSLSTVDLMKLAGDDHKKKIELTDAQRDQLFELIKERGRAELEYGEELEIDDVRLIRRVTGAVGIYFA
jgi:hypothetical protein